MQLNEIPLKHLFLLPPTPPVLSFIGRIELNTSCQIHQYIIKDLLENLDPN